MPKLFINRRTAAEHRADPAQDPDAKRSIFNQVRTDFILDTLSFTISVS